MEAHWKTIRVATYNIHRCRGLDGRTNPERIFLKRWRSENKSRQAFNGGAGVLELILSEDSNDYAADLTQRDATVAATVIQWLGTNCGRAFLHECEREIERQRETERIKSRKVI